MLAVVSRVAMTEIVKMGSVNRRGLIIGSAARLSISTVTPPMTAENASKPSTWTDG